MIIALSIERVIEEMAALSALATLLNPESNPMNSLSEDNEAALRPIITGVASEVVLPLAPLVEVAGKSSGSADDDGLLKYEINVDFELTTAKAGLIRRGIEEAVVNMSLGEIWTGVDRQLGETYMRYGARMRDVVVDYLASEAVSAGRMRANY